MAVDGPKIWVSDAGQFALAKIDADSNQVTEQIPLEFTNATGKVKRVQPFGLATDGTTLWVSDFDGNYVVRFDTEINQILAVIDDIRNPEGIAVTPGAVWVVEHRSGQIVRIDPETNQIVATISIPVSANPTWSVACGMCINYVVATADSIWIPLNRGRGVARIDPQTNKVSAVIPLGAPVHNVAIGANAIWAVGSEIGADCEKSSGFVARIDPQSNTVIGKLPLLCAGSVEVYEGNVWVGSGIISESGGVPVQTQLTLIQPD